MKIKNVTALVVALLSLALAGCVSVPNIEMQHTSAAPIRRIALLKTAPPRNVQVMNIGGAAMAFGAIGGAIQGGVNADHAKQFAAILAKQPALSEKIMTDVESSLKADGYEVIVVRDQAPKVAADGKSDDYSGVHVDADAILSVWFGVVGYMSSPYSAHYEPWVLVKARLLDAKTKKDLYFKTFCVGYKPKIENAVMLPADSRFRFGSFDDLIAHSDDAIAGIVSCEKLTADRIGSDLRVQ
jgi:outer membrane lipoprotein SlyB